MEGRPSSNLQLDVDDEEDDAPDDAPEEVDGAVGVVVVEENVCCVGLASSAGLRVMAIDLSAPKAAAVEEEAAGG